MTYEVPLNFGRRQTIDPANGMTRHQFLCLLAQYNISLDESRMHEVNYYFNVWGDTVKHNRDWNITPDFNAFITWMKKQ